MQLKCSENVQIVFNNQVQTYDKTTNMEILLEELLKEQKYDSEYCELSIRDYDNNEIKFKPNTTLETLAKIIERQPFKVDLRIPDKIDEKNQDKIEEVIGEQECNDKFINFVFPDGSEEEQKFDGDITGCYIDFVSKFISAVSFHVLYKSLYFWRLEAENE